ncbi:MAG: DNA photolyase, partial [Candidatus Sumerlaeia bacterium]|nr:DNA photolyase [Candidatus Sumerlaeia bacterium]
WEKSSADTIGEGKKVLLLTTNKGSFFKQCPGTRNYLCCLYNILNVANGCPLDCSYCVLQGYFSSPLLTVFVNTDEMQKELAQVFATYSNRVLRVGTGEFTDSLALEHLTSFSQQLIPFILRWRNVFLELKTKTSNINELEEFRNNPQVICSWSLAPQRVITEEERFTASLSERLRAAQQVQEWGLGLGFHFDPLLYYEGWEDEYYNLVCQLFKHVEQRRIYWISLGSFRFPPHLKEIIERRFPRSRILNPEFITGADGKIRYFLPLRLQLYRRLFQWLRHFAPDVAIYFCMESPLVWREISGFQPGSNAEVGQLLDKVCLLKTAGT